jgi:hypothetical protein
MGMLFILSAGQSFALPGAYKAGASTMALNIGRCTTRTIRMDGTGWGTSPLESGGFLISLSDEGEVVDIADCQCYDGTLTPAIWDPGVIPVFDPYGYPGGLFVAMTNLGPGVTPSANILVCDVTFCREAYGYSTITIDTVPDFDTWVAKDFTVYDPTIDAAVIEVSVSDPGSCACFIAGPIQLQAHVSGDPVTATYTASPSAGCENWSYYVYSDDCAKGTIDPNFGVFTVPAFTAPPEENCTITVTDTANTDINTGDPVVCTLDITILAGTCECEGNFDNDQDVDGFDAATFKADFGRGGFTRPCISSDLCNGDFSCDGDVDGSDASLFKSDFGRGQFNNPCPSCPRDPWCVY